MKPAYVLTLIAVTACSPAPREDRTATSNDVSEVFASASTDAALPAIFLGRWDANAQACAVGTEMKLTVEPRRVAFYESGGRIESIKINGPNDIVAEVAMSGEGETWQKTMHMVVTEDSKTLTINNGELGVRVRCR